MGLRHLTPSYCKRLSIRSCIPSRVLVRTKNLSEIIRPTFGLIHKIWIGHCSSKNVLIRVMKIAPSWISSKLRVVKTAPNWIRFRLGGAQDIRLTSSRWEPIGLKMIRHAKSIDWNRHRGDRDIGIEVKLVRRLAGLFHPTVEGLDPRLRVGTLPTLGFAWGI